MANFWDDREEDGEYEEETLCWEVCPTCRDAYTWFDVEIRPIGAVWESMYGWLHRDPESKCPMVNPRMGWTDISSYG